MPTERRQQPEKPKNETTYIVLEGSAGESEIVILGDTLANGPEQAVRRVVPDREGKFVAIPARNWTVIDQTSETPPPVITQAVSKWAGVPDEDEPDDEVVPESRRVDSEPAPGEDSAAATRAQGRASDDATPARQAEALAAAIEDDGA